MPRTLTAADAVIILNAPDVFSAPQQLQGFATDDVFSVNSLDIAETMMGVDGKLSGGYVPVPIDQTFMLQADSDSIDFFEAIYAAAVQQRTIFYLSGRTVLRSTEKRYVMTRGLMVGYTPMPNAKKVLQPRPFIIRWESVSPSPV